MNKILPILFILLLAFNTEPYELYFINDTQWNWEIVVYISAGHYGKNYTWKTKGSVYGDSKKGPFHVPPYSLGTLQAIDPNIHKNSALCWHKVHVKNPYTSINLLEGNVPCADLYTVIEQIDNKGNFKATRGYVDGQSNSGRVYYVNYLNAHSVDIQRRAFDFKKTQILENIKNKFPNCYTIMDNFKNTVTNQKDTENPSLYEKQYEDNACASKTGYLLYTILPESYLETIKGKISESDLKNKFPDAYTLMEDFERALQKEALTTQKKSLDEILTIIKKDVKAPSFYAKKYYDAGWHKKTSVPIYWIIPTQVFYGSHENLPLGIRLIGQVDSPESEYIASPIEVD